MAIIISENGKNAERVSESEFGIEDNLQQYIYDNPDAIPIYDIQQDTRLFIAAREFSTHSGPIDALGFDAVGNIYVVETKLYKNPDKRTVVAQALDYGASLWRHATDFDAFLAQLDQHCQKQSGTSFREQYAMFHELDDPTEQIEAIRTNLADGVVKFVVLMDRLHDALKDLVLFVNQNSKFDLYAVELEYYKHKLFEIIIPKLFGAEVKKEVASTHSSRSQWSWTLASEEAFMADVQTKVDTEAIDLVRLVKDTLAEVAQKTGGHIHFGHVVSKTREAEKLVLDSAANKTVFALDADGSVSIYCFDKSSEYTVWNNQLLDKIRSESWFDRGNLSQAATQCFFNITKHPPEQTKQLCELYLKLTGAARP